MYTHTQTEYNVNPIFDWILNYTLLKPRQNNINDQNHDEKPANNRKTALAMLIALVLIPLIPLMLVSTGADKTIIIVLCKN